MDNVLNMLGEYGNINISYSRNQNIENGNQTETQPIEEKIHSNNKKNVPIFPHFSIETPDWSEKFKIISQKQDKNEKIYI